MKITRSAALRPLLAICLCAVSGLVAAASKPWWLRGVETNENDFLPPDVAFRVGASVDGALMRVRWVIADGYYLYRSRMDIKAESPDLTLTAVTLPAGKPKVDPYLGSQQIYEQQVEATVAYSRIDAGAHPLQIKVTYQGCAEAGLCYPPITKVLFPMAVAVVPGAGAAMSGAGAASEPAGPPGSASDHRWVRNAILLGGLAFLVAGLALRRGRNLESPPA